MVADMCRAAVKVSRGFCGVFLTNQFMTHYLAILYKLFQKHLLHFKYTVVTTEHSCVVYFINVKYLPFLKSLLIQVYFQCCPEESLKLFVPHCCGVITQLTMSKSQGFLGFRLKLVNDRFVSLCSVLLSILGGERNYPQKR